MDRQREAYRRRPREKKSKLEFRISARFLPIIIALMGLSMSWKVVYDRYPQQKQRRHLDEWINNELLDLEKNPTTIYDQEEYPDK